MQTVIPHVFKMKVFAIKSLSGTNLVNIVSLEDSNCRLTGAHSRASKMHSSKQTKKHVPVYSFLLKSAYRPLI